LSFYAMWLDLISTTILKCHHTICYKTRLEHLTMHKSATC
jgi:hypothetical protein